MSGPKYDKAIEECRAVGLRDIEVADTCLHATAKALQEIGAELDSKIAEINTKIGDKPAQAAREALRSMKDDRAEIERVINQEGSSRISVGAIGRFRVVEAGNWQ